MADDLRPPVYSFIARSNTGKTTLLETLVPALQARGLRVGVLKHHSHEGLFDVPGKDTYRVAEAGADVVVGVSPLQTAVFRSRSGPYDLEEPITEFLGDVDIVLVEGYKRGPYPKIEVHRSGRSTQLLADPAELIAVVSDVDWPFDLPQFRLEDAEGVAAFLVERSSG